MLPISWNSVLYSLYTSEKDHTSSWLLEGRSISERIRKGKIERATSNAFRRQKQ